MKKNEPCKVCDDGWLPTKVIRAGRACYLCRECGRDVTLVLMMIEDARQMDAGPIGTVQ